MGLDALLARLASQDQSETPAPLKLEAGVTANAAPLLGCTPVTPVTPKNQEAGDVEKWARWLIDFPDATGREVTFSPPVELAHVVAVFTEASCAEPEIAPSSIELPADLAAMFGDCVAANLYAPEDRTIIAAMFSAGANETRQLVEAMHRQSKVCYRCRHFRRPGLSDGYCGERDDLTHAYGFLYVLPDDRGARCGSFADADVATATISVSVSTEANACLTGGNYATRPSERGTRDPGIGEV